MYGHEEPNKDFVHTDNHEQVVARRQKGELDIIDLKDEDLSSKWEEFFTDDAIRYRILEIADLYPEEKSLDVTFSELE